MTTRKNSKAAEDKAEQDDVKTAGENKSRETQTTDTAEQVENPTEPEETGEVDVEGAASGEVAGGVPRGETGIDEDFDFDADAEDAGDGSLGTVQEVGRDGSYDVPWTYLTAEQVRAEGVRTSDTDDGDARAWNVQWAGGEREGHEDGTALVPVQQTPGQTFHPSELPNIDVMEKAGIDSAQWLAGLPVRADLGADNETHRRGIPA